MKTLFVVLSILAILYLGSKYEMNPDLVKKVHKPPIEIKESEINSPLFYNGQILYPDYSHDDTLQVVDAGLLNKSIDITSSNNLKEEGINNLLSEATEEYSNK